MMMQLEYIKDGQNYKVRWSSSVHFDVLRSQCKLRIANSVFGEVLFHDVDELLLGASGGLLILNEALPGYLYMPFIQGTEVMQVND